MSMFISTRQICFCTKYLRKVFIRGAAQGFKFVPYLEAAKTAETLEGKTFDLRYSKANTNDYKKILSTASATKQAQKT